MRLCEGSRSSRKLGRSGNKCMRAGENEVGTARLSRGSDCVYPPNKQQKGDRGPVYIYPGPFSADREAGVEAPSTYTSPSAQAEANLDKPEIQPLRRPKRRRAVIVVEVAAEGEGLGWRTGPMPASQMSR